MQDIIQDRLEKLRGEYQAGEKMLQEQRDRLSGLEHRMLRISGAIQVLEETLETGMAASADHAPVADAVILPGADARAAAGGRQQTRQVRSVAV